MNVSGFAMFHLFRIFFGISGISSEEVSERIGYLRCIARCTVNPKGIKTD